MYNVSDDYIDQMNSSAVYRYALSGTLTGTGTFYKENILAGSLSINNQCASGNRIIMGSVYVGELRATFVDTNDIAIGATITLEESLYIDGSGFEEVPMGCFKVAEAVNTRFGIEVVAYDYMSKFDKKAELASVRGTVFEWLRYCCSMCGVTMAQTQQEIEALPNSQIDYACYLPEGFECTYRDVISYLAQIIGGFATMDRQGRVKLVSYAPSIPVNQITSTGRYSDSTFSMSPTVWDGVSYQYVAGDEEETIVVGDATSEDSTFAFGFNPFLQERVVGDAVMVSLLDNVIEYMRFNAFKVRVPCGACYDLGDLLTQFGGRAPNPLETIYCITSISWKYNGGTTLSGAGKNVAIGAGGYSGGGGSSGGGGEIGSYGAGAMHFYNFTNARAINILTYTEETIIDIRFVAKKATTAIFQAEILLDTTVISGQTVAVAKAKYTLNGTEDTTYYPQESWNESGKHILHLLYFIPIEGEGSNRLTVNLEMTNGDTDIGAQQIKACIYGQGLAAQEAEWDGTINAEENLYGYEADITGITSIGGITDSITVAQDTPHTRALSDAISAIDISGVLVADISDILQIDKEPLTTLTWGDAGAYTWGYIEDNYMW